MSELPSGWERLAILEVLAEQHDGRKIHQGWSPQCETEPCDCDEQWGVLKTTAIQAGLFLSGHHKRLPPGLSPRVGIEVVPGDLLLTCAGPRVRCGVACLVRNTRSRLMLSGKMYRFRPEPQVIDPRYLEAFLQTQDAQSQIDEMKTGGSESGLNLTHERFGQLRVVLAPFGEQARIVAKLEELLSELDAGVAELKAAQQKLTRYRQSLLKAAVEGALTAEWRAQHAPSETGAQLLERILVERRARWEAKQLAKFKEQGKTPPKDWQKKYPEPVPPDTSNLPELPDGWTWASIEQVAHDERHSLAIGPFGSNLKVSDYMPTGVPLVFVRNIRSSTYGLDRSNCVSPEKALELSAHRVDPGDVLITKMGDPPGDADVYPCDQPSAIITADCIKVRCWPGLINPHFVKGVVNSHIGRSQIKPMTQGVAQKKVSLGRFLSFAVPVPPYEEQETIVHSISAADRDATELVQAIEFGLRQAAAQRQNILRAAFAGELVPQDPNDEPASVLLERIRAERAAVSASPRKPRASASRSDE